MLLVLAGILVLADVTTLSLLLVLAGIQMLLRHSETLPQTLVRESDAWFRSLMLDRCFMSDPVTADKKPKASGTIMTMIWVHYLGPPGHSAS